MKIRELAELLFHLFQKNPSFDEIEELLEENINKIEPDKFGDIIDSLFEEINEIRRQ